MSSETYQAQSIPEKGSDHVANELVSRNFPSLFPMLVVRGFCLSVLRLGLLGQPDGLPSKIASYISLTV